MPATTLKNQ